MDSTRYSMPDQPARFAKAKKENNERYLHIEKYYNPDFLKGKTVLVTGANRGLGLAITKELIPHCAKVVATARSAWNMDGVVVVSGIDVQDNKVGDVLVNGLKEKGVDHVDILINNAGYFYEKLETLQALNFEEELKMVDICAVGPLRISGALVNAKLMPSGSKIVNITSQGGSINWRTVQNPDGADYGHHMSKAAANMMAVLLALEVKKLGISVGILHPGFNRTEMTKKYQDIYDESGAVDPSVGAKRVLYETSVLNLETSGKFINCEDGLEIPF